MHPPSPRLHPRLTEHGRGGPRPAGLPPLPINRTYFPPPPRPARPRPTVRTSTTINRAWSGAASWSRRRPVGRLTSPRSARSPRPRAPAAPDGRPAGVQADMTIHGAYFPRGAGSAHPITNDVRTLVDPRPCRSTEHGSRAIPRLTGHTSHDVPDILGACTHDRPGIPLAINGTYLASVTS
jgi:hypothetical protein